MYKYIKKSIILFSIIALLFPLLTSSTFLKNINTRFLQLQTQNYITYTNAGIYYKIDFPKNDITGTGDLLQDQPYRALCIVKQCPNVCCLGDINEMRCGTSANCQEFYNNYSIPYIVMAIIFPLFFVAIFFIAFCFFYKKSNKKRLSFLLALGCIFIITIPIVLYIIWKRKLFTLCGECNDCKNGEDKKYFLII